MSNSTGRYQISTALNTALQYVAPSRCSSKAANEVAGASDDLDYGGPEQVELDDLRQESRFGAEDQTETTKKLQENGADIPIVSATAVGKTGDGTVPENFDARKEYGYKYDEGSQNNEANDEDEEDDDDDDDRTYPLSDDVQTNGNMIPLHQKTTAFVTKSHERIPYIHLLGKTYHPVHDYHTRKEYEASLYWFTYRSDFPEIAPYRITSDAGWGCMLRSAQMLLAHTLRVHFKSRNWRPPTSLIKSRQDEFVSSLMRWFADFPSKTESVYSLQNMVAAGFAKYETLPGEWYGPGTACYVLRDLVTLHSQTQPSLFRVHVSSEGTVYRQAVHNLMTRDSKKRAEERRQKEEQSTETTTSSPPSHPLDPTIPPPSTNEDDSLEWDTSLLLLVPLRLGLDNFNEKYVKCLAQSFWIPQSVGVLGGRPRGARWFYGAYADGTKVLGLDPHTVQAAPTRKKIHAPAGSHIKGQNTVVDLSDEYLRSVHTAYPEIYPINRMDPSLAIGFYCRDKKEFLNLQASLEELKKADPTSPDLFTFADNAPDFLSTSVNDMMLGELEGDDLVDNSPGDDSDDDSYVLL